MHAVKRKDSNAANIQIVGHHNSVTTLQVGNALNYSLELNGNNSGIGVTQNGS